MWREFTRERPARPYLAWGCSALALVTAVGSAWLVVRSRAQPTTEGLQSLPHWPIAFTLPGGLTWSPDEGARTNGMSADGMSGSMLYVGRSAGWGPSVMIVGFQVFPEGTTPEQVLKDLTGRAPGDAQRIRMGPMKGVMLELPAEQGKAVRLVGAGCTERGLAVVVQHVTPAPNPQARRIFRAVCRSIEYKAWWIRPSVDGLLLMPSGDDEEPR
jgi:hypothetical protein